MVSNFLTLCCRSEDTTYSEELRSRRDRKEMKYSNNRTSPFSALSSLILLYTLSSVMTSALPNSSSSSNSFGVEGVEDLFQEGIWDPHSYDPLELFIDVPAAGIGYAKPDVLVPWVEVRPRIDYKNMSWQRVLLGISRFEKPRYIGRVHLREKDQGKPTAEAKNKADYEILCNFFQDDGKDLSDTEYRRITIGEAFRPEEEMNLTDLADGIVCHAFIV